ncbi:MAG: PilZ domain-containing protein [Terriglobia bacterium]
MERDYDRRAGLRLRGQETRIEFFELQPRLRDLSMSGAYIEDPRPLRPGRMVRMRIWLGDDASITVRGMIRRVDEGAGMAMEFVEISEADRTRLRNFLRTVAQREQLQFF